jgi:flagellar protein FliO/FliZ
MRPLHQLAASLLACISFAASAVLPTVPTPAPAPAPSFAVAGLVQAGLGLAVVIGLIFLFAWVARRLGLQSSGNSRVLKVVSSAMVGQRERVVVVEVGDAWLVLGVAAGQVNTLHTMPAGKTADVQAPSFSGANASGSVFSQKMIDSMSRLTKLKRDAS